eukprot:1982652-Rhodomonas_salina.2
MELHSECGKGQCYLNKVWAGSPSKLSISSGKSESCSSANRACENAPTWQHHTPSEFRASYVGGDVNSRHINKNGRSNRLEEEHTQRQWRARSRAREGSGGETDEHLVDDDDEDTEELEGHDDVEEVAPEEDASDGERLQLHAVPRRGIDEPGRDGHDEADRDADVEDEGQVLVQEQHHLLRRDLAVLVRVVVLRAQSPLSPPDQHQPRHPENHQGHFQRRCDQRSVARQLVPLPQVARVLDGPAPERDLAVELGGPDGAAVLAAQGEHHREQHQQHHVRHERGPQVQVAPEPRPLLADQLVEQLVVGKPLHLPGPRQPRPNTLPRTQSPRHCNRLPLQQASRHQAAAHLVSDDHFQR